MNDIQHSLSNIWDFTRQESLLLTPKSWRVLVYSWFSVGSDSIDFIRAVALQRPTSNFSINLRVRFPNTERYWDGNGMLDVVSGVFVLPAVGGEHNRPDPVDTTAPGQAALPTSAAKEIVLGLERLRVTVIWVAAALAAAIVYLR